jgi:glycosyltransferase involved in cell wall biosynthesis
MPVLVVSHGYEAIYERGFCNGLSDSGFDFVLISSDRTDYAGLRPGTRTLNLRGSQDEKRPRWSKMLNLLRYHAALMWHVLWQRRPVLHMMGLIEPAVLAGILSGLWFRLFCRQYVMTVHDLLPHDRGTRKNKLLYGISYRLAHKLVVHTQKARSDLVAMHGVRADRVLVMEHGLEPLRGWSVPATRVEGPVRILFFGKVLRYKGLDILFDALAKVSWPFEVTIAGVCRDGVLTAELEERIAAHPGHENIRWLNRFIEEDELAPLFEKADVLVLPYRHIDQSGVFFQALRFGVPIVATRVGSFAEYLSSDIGELASAITAEAFGAALERFRERRQSMTREHVTEVGRRYEWQNTVKALDSIYPLRAAQAAGGLAVEKQA